MNAARGKVLVAGQVKGVATPAHNDDAWVDTSKCQMDLSIPVHTAASDGRTRIRVRQQAEGDARAPGGRGRI